MKQYRNKFVSGVRIHLIRAGVISGSEGTESFYLNLSNPVNATISDSQGVGTITQGGSNIIPNVVTYTTTGVAPQAIHFDATGTTAAAYTSRPFHALEYRWDFGDGNTSTWARGLQPGSLLKRIAFGPVASYVYETPGTFLPVLQVRYRLNDGSFDTITLNCPAITVISADAAWPTTQTVCYSTNTDFTGAPAGCVQVPNVTDIAASIEANLGTGNKRHLLHGDQTFPAPTNFSVNVGTVAGVGQNMVGQFGSGAKPIWNRTANVVMVNLSSPSTPLVVENWRFVDILFEGNSNTSACISGEGSCRKMLFLRCELQNVGYGLTFSGSLLSGLNTSQGNYTHAMWDQISFVDGRIYNIIGSSGPCAIFGGFDRIVVKGNLIDNNSGGEHGYRTQYTNRAVLSYNTIQGIAVGKANLTIRGGSFAGDSTSVPGLYSEKNIVSYNEMVAGASAGIMGIGPQNSFNDERGRNMIVECNLFRGSSSTGTVSSCAQPDITYRNNVALLHSGVFCGIEKSDMTPVPTNVHFYNNTIYASGTGGVNLVAIAIGAGTGFEQSPLSSCTVIAKNNLVYAPNAIGYSTTFSNVYGTGDFTTSSNNSTTDQMFNVPPNFTTQPPTTLAHVRPVSGYAVDGGVRVDGVYRDIFGSELSLTPNIGSVDGTAPAELIVPIISTNRVIGVAPLYVHFDASGTTAPSLTTQPFHDIAYKWTFGDISAGNWANGALAQFGHTSSKNIDYGSTAAHVFETPGTYTVTLDTWNGDINGPAVTVEITVQDPNIIFSGNNTICIANGETPVEGVNGVPMGAECVNCTDGDADVTWALHNANGKRILWKRGHTFQVSTPIQVDKAGPGIIGAFGLTGADPIFNLTAGLGVWQVKSTVGSPNSDWRIMDIRNQGNSIAGSAGIFFTEDFNQVTCVRVTAVNCTFGFKSSPSNQNSTLSVQWDQHCFYDCTVIGGQGSSGGNGFYTGANRTALIGANIDTNELGEHGARMAHAHKAVIAHNTIKRIADGRAALTIRSGGLTGETPHAYMTPFLQDGYTTTQHLVMRDNYAESYLNRPTAMGIGPLNNYGTGRHRNALIECNYTDHGRISGQGVDITIRSNIINRKPHPGVIFTSDIFQQQYLDDQIPRFQNVRCYHNSTYSSDNVDETVFYFPAGTDCGSTSSIEIRNNLAYGPNATNDYYESAGLVNAGGQTITLTHSYNTTWAQVKTVNPFPVSGPTTPMQMKPSGGSYAIGTSFAAPVWYDFFGTRIQPSVTPRTLGAIQA